MSSKSGGGGIFFGRGSTGDSAPMRGLVTFIADLRNARARDLEEKRINKELANIRDKFKDTKLSGYQKKKYVCKLLYIYILGWDVDFGHLEAVSLISARNYSEKQIGYLAVTLFFHEQHELLHLVVNSIRKDLLDNNEMYNCLALHAIANVGGREMGEALSVDVHRLLISPTSRSFVKKKAALTLLRLYRKHPGIVQTEWAERILSIMDDEDMGVALSVTSLIQAIVQNEPDQYKGSYVKAARRLKAIAVDGDCPTDYHYYRVPCPWLQIKLLKLLQSYPPSTDEHIRGLIRVSVQRIMDNAMADPKNVQQNNVQNAVLFEAINLVIHLDTEQELMVQISSRLGKFITSRETNVRYLGLEAMTHLATRTEALDPIKKHQNIIIGSLRDRDITVRRQGLDLLYAMCDSTNSQPIVGELLKYLATADYAIREEMVLKIAVLTEKYATDVQWYVNISLRLISMAGDHVSDEVWQRIIMIVTNNEELQAYAAQNILNYIKQESCHEMLVKIGGYVLGEFGHLIADHKGCSPIEQLLALQSKFNTCSTNTRAILLSCFIKFVNLFPEIKSQLLSVFRMYSYTSDAELQQRACEYLALATLPTDDLLRAVCDEMPPFPERASALLSRVQLKHGGSTEMRKEIASREQVDGLKRSFPNGANSQLSSSAQEHTLDIATAIGATKAPKPGNRNFTNDLSGLDLSQKPPSLQPTAKSVNLASADHLSPGWKPGYDRLILRADGILYEDAQIQIGLRSEVRSAVCALILYFTNKTFYPINSLTTTYDTREPANLTMETKSLPETTLSPDAQTQQTMMFTAKSVFTSPPTLRITWHAGSLQALTLQLPLLLTRYLIPASTLSSEDFFKRWKQIGGAPRESQRVFELVRPGAVMTDARSIRSVVEGFGWGVLEGVDPNPRNIVAASVLSLEAEGGGVAKVGCLCRVEPNLESKMYRLTIRATDESVPPVLLAIMEERLAQGITAD